MSKLDYLDERIATFKQALAQSDDRYRLLIDMLPHGIQECDSEGLITFSNPAHSKMHGYDEGELLGWRIWELQADQSRQRELQIYLTYLVREQPEPTPYFTKDRTKNGNLIDVQIDWLYQRDEKGKVTGFLSIITDITNKKTAEESLLRERDIAKHYLDLTGEIILAIDLEQNVTQINQEGCQLLGCKESEIFGKNWFDHFLPPSNREKSRSAFTQFCQGELKHFEHYENEVLTTRGEVRAISWNRSVHTDDAGKILGTLSAGKDITEQKRVEQSLMDSENHAQTILDTTADGIITINAQGIIESFNSAAERIFGYRSNEVIGQNVKLLMPSPYREEHDKYIQHFLKTQQPKIIGFGRELTGKRKNETIFPIELAVSEFEIEGHLKFTGVVRDISKRKRAERKIIENENHFRLFCIASGDCFWNWDTAEGTVERSSGYERIFGYQKQEISPSREWWSDRIHPDDKPRVWKMYGDAVEQGKERCRFEYRFRCKNGSYAVVDDHVCFVRDAAGKVVRSLGAMHDITIRKQAEKEIQTNNSVLENIGRVQREFLVKSDPSRSFEKLLSVLLEVSASEYGFIGEFINEPGEKVFLKTHAITNIAWNDEIQAFYEQNIMEGLKFNHLETLDGSVMKTGSPVISNDVVRDLTSRGLPDGHPPLLTFLGFPFFHGSEMVGMVGIANRLNGYDEHILKTLEPIQETCASLMRAYQVDSQRNQATKALEISERRYRHIVEDHSEFIIRWNPNGERIFVNPAYCNYFGQSLEEIIGTSFYLTVKEEDISAVQQKIESLQIESPVANDERRVITPNGKVRWNAWTDRAIFDEQNRIVEYQSVGRDITSRMSREQTLGEDAKIAARMSLLTDREHEVLNWVVKGKTNKVIAKELSISDRTVEKHRSNTMRKLQANSTAELVRIALITGDIIANDCE